MKTPLLLLTAFLAVTKALSAHEKRQSTNRITDGSFEDISDDYELDTNVDVGGWSFRKRCTMDYNVPNPGGGGCPPDTPYGDKYAIFWNFHKIESRGTVSQALTGLSGGAFTLKYSWHLDLVQEAICTFSVTLGSQTIDSFPVPIGSNHCEGGPWKTRTRTFTPAQAGGDLSFQVHCPQSHAYWRIFLDNVSLVGPM